MTFMISYFILFVIITFANGKPNYKEDSYLVKNQYELVKLLELLGNQGNYDISFSQYEDNPKRHHEGSARLSHHDDKPSKYNHNERSNSARYHASHENVDRYDNARFNDIENLDVYNKKKSNNLDKLSRNDNNVLDKLMALASKKYRSDKADESEYDNAEDVIAFLSDLQKSLADNGNYESQLRLKKNKYRNEGDRFEDKTFNDKYDRDGLRCKGNKCTRNRDVRSNRYDDDRNDRNIGRDRDEDNDRGNRDSLRCRGKSCARSKYDDSDYNVKPDSNLLRKKIKISDDLDAVVLDISDVDRLLSKFNNVPKQRTNKLKGAKLLENIDLESLLDNRSDNDKNSNVEAVVIDLRQIEDGDAVAKQIKRLLSQNNEQNEADYEDYGNFVEDTLSRGSIDFDKTSKIRRGSSQILAHKEDNNNVYVPQWLLKEVISRTTLRDQVAERVHKSMFPLTKQQKERINKSFQNRKHNVAPQKIFRRNFEQDLGVPFHLEVQGLGQVSP